MKPCRECGVEVSDSAAVCPSCGVKRPVPAPWYRKKRTLMLASVAVLWWSCSRISNTPSTPPPPPVAAVGSEVTLSVQTGLVFVAVDEATHAEFVTLSIANDGVGISNLARSGRAFGVESGTRARVIDRGFERRRVRILTGEHAGKDGWVLSSLAK